MSKTPAVNKILRAGMIVFLIVLPCKAVIAAGGTRCYVSEEESEVYVDFLRAASSQGSVQVIEARTAQFPSNNVDFLNLELAAKGHGIPSAAREDFKRKNKDSCLLKRFQIDGVKILSPRENDKEDIFDNNWKGFHRKYSKDAELLTFSRVGFNSDKTIAIVHVSAGIGSMAGSGMLYVMRKIGRKWMVSAQIFTWTT